MMMLCCFGLTNLHIYIVQYVQFISIVCTVRTAVQCTLCTVYSALYCISVAELEPVPVVTTLFHEVGAEFFS